MDKMLLNVVEDIRGRYRMRVDGDEKWVTMNGTHVMIDDDGNPTGKVGEKIKKSVISDELQKHFDKENKRVRDFMRKKVGTGQSIEMDNGQIFEHYSMDEMKSLILQEYKENGVMDEDFAVAILYRDGSIATYSEGDDTSKMKLSNIQGVIYDNPMTSAYAGTGVKIENYNETCAGDKNTRYGTSEDEDDWRLDFE